MRNAEDSGKDINSMEIRKALAKFLRSVLGFNNRIPKKLPEALVEIKRAPNPIEPEWIWPEAHAVESLEPSEEKGWLN